MSVCITDAFGARELAAFGKPGNPGECLATDEELKDSGNRFELKASAGCDFLKGLESAAATTRLITDVANDAHTLALLGEHVTICRKHRDGATDRHARTVKLLRELSLRRQIALISVCAVVNRLLHGVINGLKDGSRHDGLLELGARAMNEGRPCRCQSIYLLGSIIYLPMARRAGSDRMAPSSSREATLATIEETSTLPESMSSSARRCV